MMYILLDAMPHLKSLPDFTYQVKSFEIYGAIKMLVYAIAGLLGLAGGIRIYSLWNISGRAHIHIDAQVIGWFSACVFLIVADFAISSVFGV